MIYEKDLLEIICDKLGIENPEQYYRDMKKRKQSNCNHDFKIMPMVYGIDKGSMKCDKCGLMPSNNDDGIVFRDINDNICKFDGGIK